MSDEFLKLARQEIQSEIDSLKNIFHDCTDDEQLYKKSTDVEKHVHKIKGLAPMMGQDAVGEIARICSIILKHVTNHGILKDSHKMILEAIQTMSDIFGGSAHMEMDSFQKKVNDIFPDILVS